MFMPYQQSSKVIFMAKTSFYIFSLRREDVWTCSVLDDCIYEMKIVLELGHQGIKI